MSKIIRANFNIKEELWSKFKKLVKQKDTNASYTIIQLIKNYIEGNTK